MRRAWMTAWLLGLGAMPLAAQEQASWQAATRRFWDGYLPSPGTAAVSPDPPTTAEATDPLEPPPWRTAWGLIGLRAIPEGPKVAPNGLKYHPNFSLDLDFDFWVWRTHGLYIFTDVRIW